MGQLQSGVTSVFTGLLAKDICIVLAVEMWGRVWGARGQVGNLQPRGRGRCAGDLLWSMRDSKGGEKMWGRGNE